MKKHIILLSLLAVCAMANAQMTTRIVYIPGDGERQFGFNLIPSYCNQHLNLFASDFDDAGSPFDYKVDGTLNSLLGFSAGIFYGYETTHGNFIEWGNYTSLFYRITPFSGEATFIYERGGIFEKHKVRLLDQRVILHLNPFLSHSFNEQFSASLGLGLSIAPRLSGKIFYDGESMQEDRDMETSIIQNIFNIHLDVNAGVKYWLSEEWFTGLRVQYSFGNVFALLSDEFKYADASLDNVNGKVTLYLDNKTANSMILDKRAIQAVLAIGYCW